MTISMPKSFIPPKEPRHRPVNPPTSAEDELLEHLARQEQRKFSYKAPTNTTNTDFGELMQTRITLEEVKYQRKLVYKDEVGIFKVVIGVQVVRANTAGVYFYPNGKEPSLRFLPWHRVWEFNFHYQDPIGQF